MIHFLKKNKRISIHVVNLRYISIFDERECFDILVFWWVSMNLFVSLVIFNIHMAVASHIRSSDLCLYMRYMYTSVNILTQRNGECSRNNWGTYRNSEYRIFNYIDVPSGTLYGLQFVITNEMLTRSQIDILLPGKLFSNSANTSTFPDKRQCFLWLSRR